LRYSLVVSFDEKSRKKIFEVSREFRDDDMGELINETIKKKLKFV